MAVDPLSTSTRAIKRNLLAAATGAIIYRAFDVSISKIPIGGVAIEFDGRVFTFILLVAIAYFLATFALYYFIDIRNVEPTRHQASKEERYENFDKEYSTTHALRVISAIKKSLPAGITFDGNGAPELVDCFRRIEDPLFEEKAIEPMVGRLVSAVHLGYEKKTRTESRRPITPAENPELYKRVGGQFRRVFVKYKRRKSLSRIGLVLPSLYGVRLLYIIRNYVVDGILPIALAVLALAALFQLVDLQWLRSIVPPSD